MRLTVGPLPPGVYWRRRAFVLGAVLLGLFLVAQACMAASATERPLGSGPTTAPTTSAPVVPPTTPADPSSTPVTPSLPPVAPAAGEELGEDGCTDDELLVRAEADQTSVAPGSNITFTIVYRNDSDRGCLRDVGPDLRELSLRQGSGADWVWSSRDCSDLRGREVQELAPGVDQSHWIVWNGRASGSCDDTEPAGEVVAPGEYELVARVGTAHSESITITVTDPS